MRGDKRNPVRSRPSKRNNRGTRHNPYRWTLRVEQLEDRRLLATLATDFRFLSDAVLPDGSFAPGTTELAGEMQGNTLVVSVEDPASFFPFSFWAELRVEDRRESPDTSTSAGIIALPLNVQWKPEPSSDAVSIRYNGSHPIKGLHPISYDVQEDNPLVTPNFGLQRFVDDLGTAGQFTNLRGAALPNIQESGQEIGKDGLETFSQMRFAADTIGKTCFFTELAGSMSFADAAMLDSAEPASACIQFDAPHSASLSGFVYADSSKDGQRDVDDDDYEKREKGLPGVEIEVYHNGVFVASDRTGPDGWYHFENLTPGIYELRQPIQPECFLDGAESLGTIWPLGESRGTVGEDRITGIELRAGEAGIDYNFGELGLRAACVHKAMLLGSAKLTQATIHEPLDIPSATIRGTVEADTFRVTIDTTAIRVTVNDGPPQTFPTSNMQIVSIDALAGQDTVIVEGSAADELGHFQPDHFTYRNNVCYPVPPAARRCQWTWALEAINTEDVAMHAAAGQDLAVVRDSAGSDTLRTEGTRATIGLSEQVIELLAFERLRAFSTRGGNDRADFIGPLPLPVELFGNWVQ